MVGGSARSTSGAPDAVRFLRGIDLFGGLSDDQLVQLAAATEPVEVLGGEVLIRQGEPGSCLYVVRTGRLRVTVERDGTEALSGYVGRGEVVGEMALISDEDRTATVVADRDSDLVRVPTAAFDALVVEHPIVLRRIATQVVRRMRRSMLAPPVAAPRATVCVLSLGLGDLADAAARALVARLVAEVDGAVVASRQRAAAELGRPEPDLESVEREAWTRWVADLEDRHDLVVFAPEPGDESWAHRCIRQSDLVVVVAEARGDRSLRPVEDALATRRHAVSTRIELVLVRPDWVEDPRGTAAWLASRSVDAHHHVRAGDAADVGRVVRLVTGRASTLVLSGGGARGIAHVGVVRALQERGVPIDAVGGTSIGSLVGAAVARGWRWERIESAMRSGLAVGRLLDPTLPLVSLAAGRRVTSRLRAAGDDLDLEDLHLDYFCISTNLSRKCPVVHRRGPGWRAVRASLAIPGLFPPVPDGEDVLVDGGLLDNFPVGRMRTLHPGATVVGSDVGARHDLSAAGLPADGQVTARDGLRFLASRSRRPHDVTLAKVLAGLTELGSAPVGADEPDVAIRPVVQDLGILDFERFDELVARGYDASLAALDDSPVAEGLGGR